MQVSLDGLVLADSPGAPFLLFETDLPTRYYLPPGDVRTDVLVDSPTVTACPYKGVAKYWSLDGAGEVGRDIAWSYPNPIDQQPRLANLVCFFNEKVDLLVDGEPQERPTTPWSWLPATVTGGECNPGRRFPAAGWRSGRPCRADSPLRIVVVLPRCPAAEWTHSGHLR